MLYDSTCRENELHDGLLCPLHEFFFKQKKNQISQKIIFCEAESIQKYTCQIDEHDQIHGNQKPINA